MNEFQKVVLEEAIDKNTFVPVSQLLEYGEQILEHDGYSYMKQKELLDKLEVMLTKTPRQASEVPDIRKVSLLLSDFRR